MNNILIKLTLPVKMLLGLVTGIILGLVFHEKVSYIAFIGNDVRDESN